MFSFLNVLLRRWKTIDRSCRFAISAFVLVRLFYALWSWAILTLQPLAVQNIELFDEPVLTIFSLQGNQGYTYSRIVDRQSLEFQASNSATIIDHQTGSLWDISTGSALQGPKQGSRLSPSRTPPSAIFSYLGTSPCPINGLAIWQRFDANWYTSIAEFGYGRTRGDTHFPPLFPLLIRLIKPLVGNAFLAGLLLSHLAALYAVKLLYDLFLQWGEQATAERAVTMTLVYPASFFLFSAYTESLFMVTVLLALRFMKARSWAWAGFWTFCAILTRLQGIALLLPMIYLMWLDPPGLKKFSHWFCLGISGLSGLLYLFLRSAQTTKEIVPLVETDLHARLTPPWENYGYALRTLFSGKATFIDLLNLIIAVGFLALVLWGWRRFPLEYNLYAGLSLIVITMRLVDTQPLNSMSRYALTLFPAFYTLGYIGENPWLRRLILYTFVLLNLYLSAQFFLWGWVA